MRTRAPRNRTLTVAPQDAARLARELKRSQCVFNADFQDVLPTLPKASVDLLFLDPPYNLTKDYGHVQFQKKSAEEYEAWFSAWFERLLPLLKPNASVYACCDWRTSVSVHNVISRFLFVRNRITWEREKGRGALENWKNCSEDIWYATVSMDDFTFNVDAVKLKRKVIAPYTRADGTPKDWDRTAEGNFRLTYPSNLWTDISIPFWSMPENTDHPTQKPEKLLAKLILASTNPGELVFDPFLGSGTSAVVARKLGRRFIGVEINHEYAIWTMKRLELAADSPGIQGYADGVFCERNSGKGSPSLPIALPSAPIAHRPRHPR